MSKRKKKKTLALAGGFAVLALTAATFAWFTSDDSKKNHFESSAATGKDIEVVETFEPPVDWEPGSEVNKDVAISNVGETKSLVRVSLKESLELLTDAGAKETSDGSELAGKTNDQAMLISSQLPAGYTESTLAEAAPSISIKDGAFSGDYTLVVFEKANGTEYSYRYAFKKGSEYFRASNLTSFTRDADGKVSLKKGEVPKLNYIDLTYNPALTGDWAAAKPTAPSITNGSAAMNSVIQVGTPAKLAPIQINFVNLIATPDANADSWYYNADDGYFYYMKAIEPGASTVQMMDSVQLLPEADNTYSKLKYDLTVKGEGISAFKAAVDQWIPDTNSALSKALKENLPEK